MARLDQTKIDGLAQEFSGGSERKRDGIATVLRKIPDFMMSVAQFVEGNPRPFIEQMAQFVEFPYHAIQENPLNNDITRGLMAVFLTYSY